MNFHTRSFSEQQPQINTPNVAQPESFIRVYSDSQQSLDQLFNPNQSVAKPLRHRNLPASFFNQSLKEDEPATGPSTNPGHFNQTSNLHARSISFDHRPGAGRSGLHVRTQSMLAPMPALQASGNTSQQSSNLSSYMPSQENLLHASGGLESNVEPSNNSTTNMWSNSQSQLNNIAEVNPVDHAGMPRCNIPSQISYQQQIPPSQGNSMTQISAQEHSHQQYSCNHAQQPTEAFPPGAEPYRNPPPASVGNAHSRSISYDQRSYQPRPVSNHSTLHMRTHSTIVPNYGGNPLENGSFDSPSAPMNYPYHNTQTTTGCPSSGYSSDDMTSSVNNIWIANPPNSIQQPSAATLVPSQLPMQPSSGGPLATQQSLAQTQFSQVETTPMDSQIYYNI